MKDTLTETSETQTTVGLNSNLKLGVGIALAAVISWGGWVTSELNTVKTLLANSNTKVVEADVRVIAARMDNLERRGSDPVQSLQKSVDEIKAKLDLHMSATK